MIGEPVGVLGETAALSSEEREAFAVGGAVWIGFVFWDSKSLFSEAIGV